LKLRAQSKANLVLLILLSVLYLAAVLFFKYYLNNISLRKIRFNCIGNIINMSITADNWYNNTYVQKEPIE
jgi:hypothetical protein